MAPLEGYADMIEEILCDRARFYSSPQEFRTLLAFDRDHGQFLLIDEGWSGYRRIHRVWAHVELRDDKVWIHEDGTEEGIANLLLSASVPQDHIVLAFQSPSQRLATDFATA